MNALALPDPSGFRTITLPRFAHARLFAGRLVHEYVEYSYSRLDGDHQFVYPVKYHKTVMEIANDFFARQKRQTPEQTTAAKAAMARTIRNAYRDSWLSDS